MAEPSQRPRSAETLGLLVGRHAVHVAQELLKLTEGLKATPLAEFGDERLWLGSEPT